VYIIHLSIGEEMIDRLFLKTEGYQVSFEIEPMPHLKDEVDVKVGFLLDPCLGNVALTSSPMPLSLKDLQRLKTYLEQHIAHLQADPDSESYTFVPLDLQFQLQAFSGEIRSPDDGEFTLRFMINANKPNEERSSVYIGGEAIVTLENVSCFLSSIGCLLSEKEARASRA
jgi:hypothetical protein